VNLSQQRILVFLGIAAVLAIGGWWFATRQRQVVLENQLPKSLASDPWAASRDFLESMGLETDESTRLDDILSKADDHDVVILDLQGPPPDQIQISGLGYWIQRGGRLIVEADAGELLEGCVLPAWGVRRGTSHEPSDDESCPESLRNAWTDASQRRQSESTRPPEEDDTDALEGGLAIRSEVDSEGSGVDESVADVDTVDMEADSDSELDVPSSLPGEGFAWRTVHRDLQDTTDAWDSLHRFDTVSGGPTYRLGVPVFDSLSWSRHRPRNSFADPGGFALIGSLGKGSLVVVSDLSPFQRTRLEDWDHASVLWRLVGPGQEPRTAWIAKRARLEGWLSMLAGRIPLALGLGAFTLLLGMWTAASRFGPVLVAPREEKTGIVDHAEGAGRWLWQFHGGRLKLLAALRESARRKQLRTHPELVGADPRTLGKALEAEGLGTAAALDEAFSSPEDTSPKHFLSVAKTLWSLRRNR